MNDNPLKSTPKPKNKKMAKATVLEVRINSVHDAKSAVQNQLRIATKLKKEGFTHLQFFIAEEVRAEAMPLLAGVFPGKIDYKGVALKEDRALFVLPPFKER